MTPGLAELPDATAHPPLRVLHVEGGAHLYGGAQQVLYLLEGLQAHGVQSHLACRSGCELARRAAAVACVHELPMGGDLDVLLIPRLYRLIRAIRPDLVHLHSRIGADVMGGLAATLARVPAVHTRRVDNPEPRWLAALKYRLFERVIAISGGIAEVLRAAGVPAERLRVVRSAVPADPWAGPCRRAEVLARLGLPADARLIGMVAQLIPRKGHRFLLAALAPLLTADPSLHLMLFGQGPEEQAIRSHIASAGLAGRVHLAGFRDDLTELLPCLTVLAHPALLEGLGVSLLQAAAAGVPIVASAVGGIPEAVVDGETGLLVPPGDVPALRAALARLLADAPLRQRMGAAGAARVRALFDARVMVSGNLAVYREVLGRAE